MCLRHSLSLSLSTFFQIRNPSHSDKPSISQLFPSPPRDRDRDRSSSRLFLDRRLEFVVILTMGTPFSLLSRNKNEKQKLPMRKKSSSFSLKGYNNKIHPMMHQTSATEVTSNIAMLFPMKLMRIDSFMKLYSEESRFVVFQELERRNLLVDRSEIPPKSIVIFVT